MQANSQLWLNDIGQSGFMLAKNNSKITSSYPAIVGEGETA